MQMIRLDENKFLAIRKPYICPKPAKGLAGPTFRYSNILQHRKLEHLHHVQATLEIYQPRPSPHSRSQGPIQQTIPQRPSGHPRALHNSPKAHAARSQGPLSNALHREWDRVDPRSHSREVGIGSAYLSWG